MSKLHPVMLLVVFTGICALSAATTPWPTPSQVVATQKMQENEARSFKEKEEWRGLKENDYWILFYTGLTTWIFVLLAFYKSEIRSLWTVLAIILEATGAVTLAVSGYTASLFHHGIWAVAAVVAFTIKCVCLFVILWRWRQANLRPTLENGSRIEYVPSGIGVTFHLARAVLNAYRRETPQSEPRAPHTVLIESEGRIREGPKKTPNPDPALSRSDILWRQARHRIELSRARRARRYARRHKL